MQSEIVNLTQINKIFGKNIGRDRILELLNNGIIKSARIGGKLVCRRSTIDEFIHMVFEEGFSSDKLEIVPVHKKVKQAKEKFNPEPSSEEGEKKKKKDKKIKSEPLTEADPEKEKILSKENVKKILSNIQMGNI